MSREKQKQQCSDILQDTRANGCAWERCLLGTGCWLCSHLSDSSCMSGEEKPGRPGSEHPSIPVHWLPFLPCGLANMSVPHSHPSLSPKSASARSSPQHLQMHSQLCREKQSVGEFSFPLLWTRASLWPHLAKYVMQTMDLPEVRCSLS